ncbi:hypothetical protein MHU86_4699 [Fragilaria crotonensis]|nr:hypothetical protein MHU86_4699 [Fragilaria crotonensis]
MTTCRIVHRTGHTDDTNTAIDDQFGLWSYTDSKGECQSYDFKSPTSIVSLGDQLFRSARGLAIAGTCLGFFAMAGMWMGALREHVGRKKSRTKRARWKVCVAGGLILCSIIEGMTLLLLRSEACHSTTTTTTENSSRLTCRLGDEGWWVLAGTLQYLVTGFLVLGWPNASKNYTHSSLAGDESEEGEHEYPAEVADADAFWDGFWKGLGSEEVELGNMPTTPYRGHVEQVTNLARHPTRSMLPQQQQASQSLRDLLLAFDSELVSFEPMNPDHHDTSAVVAATKPPFVELPPSPRVIEPPSVSLERLRQQSKIAARADVVVAGVDQGEDAPSLSSPSSAATSSMPGVEFRSRDSLKSVLNGLVVPSVNGRRQQQSNSNPSWQNVRSSWRVPTSATHDPPRRSLNFLLDAFDDDIT